MLELVKNTGINDDSNSQLICTYLMISKISTIFYLLFQGTKISYIPAKFHVPVVVTFSDREIDDRESETAVVTFADLETESGDVFLTTSFANSTGNYRTRRKTTRHYCVEHDRFIYIT